MSNWREAVADWNKRLQDDGWRSTTAQLTCPTCHQIGVILTTIYGQTKATCPCGQTWVVAC